MVVSFAVVLLVMVTIVEWGTPHKFAKAFIESVRSFAKSVILLYTASTNLISLKQI